MKFKLTRTAVVLGSAGLLLILLDRVAYHGYGLWMIGFLFIAFGVLRSQLRQMDAAREEQEQQEFEKELAARKKRRKQFGEVDRQKEQLRRQLETEAELDRLRRK